MAKSTFVYVIYIRTTPQALWRALLEPEFTQQYWMGMRQESDWTVGAPWKLVSTDGLVTDTGEVLEFEPNKRLVLRWRNEFKPELKAEGYGRCEIALEPEDATVKLTITHSLDRDEAKLIGAVSWGWPRILSNLKSLLETEKVIL